MTNADIQEGQCYTAKVSATIVPVLVLSKHECETKTRAGWRRSTWYNVRNLRTKRNLKIKSPQRFRSALTIAEANAMVEASK